MRNPFQWKLRAFPENWIAGKMLGQGRNLGAIRAIQRKVISK